MEGLSRDIGPGLIDHCVGEGSGIVFRVVMGASRQTDRNTNTLTTGSPQINKGGEREFIAIYLYKYRFPCLCLPVSLFAEAQQTGHYLASS